MADSAEKVTKSEASSSTTEKETVETPEQEREKSGSRKRSHSAEKDGSDSGKDVVSTSSDGNSEEEKGSEEKNNEAAAADSSCSEEKVLLPEVHSANAWERADMDNSRKAKFLRLMGAGKVKTKSMNRLPANPKECRRWCNFPAFYQLHHLLHSFGFAADSGDRKDLESNLEEEYKSRMSDHLKQRDKKHRGLGYHVESGPSLDSQAEGESAPQFVAPTVFGESAPQFVAATEEEDPNGRNGGEEVEVNGGSRDTEKHVD